MSDATSVGVDSAFLVAKYFSKYPLFTDWIHNSFAQEFSNETSLTRSEQWVKGFTDRMKASGWTDDAITQRIKELEDAWLNRFALLEKMNASHNDTIRQAVHPLYIWVEARKNTGKKGVLADAAREYQKMSPAVFQVGNGGRYALLTYSMLLNSGESKRAADFLNSLIRRLEPLASDSLNAQRYAHQNLLAHAWFLKYQESLSADSSGTLRYLSKASEYSPRSKKESAYISFYDRSFLHSKESYRAEFLSALFKTNDQSGALDVIVDHINANPEQLGEIRKMYESHFTGKRFADFFAARIVPSWPAAVDFRLKGLDGKEYALKDYSGKWLVLDFWGTWCAPCKEEMPSLNTFSQETGEGKFRNVSFLSVACRDTEQKVKDYFAAHNFSMPAVMADVAVEKNYAVRGYPSKVIVSPEGRMLALRFGSDWKDLVVQLSSINE